MTRAGYFTSLVGLLHSGNATDGAPLDGVQIPMIQRDYAQGRADETSTAIRREFVRALLEAASGEREISLDFVYGAVEGGELLPLDGQQRLTTLFLLHWYLASRAQRLDTAEKWTRFSYATRPSSRTFCRRLTSEAFPAREEPPSEWLRDRPWFQFVWIHDPTIQSMLVMLDEIHLQFEALGNASANDAWARLTDSASPAVSFHVLPIEDMGAPETLYIKMNSRGKPLTPFENFKAAFEQGIAEQPRATEFAHKIDGAWTDLMWPWRGEDGIVDDEFFRLFDFFSDMLRPRGEQHTVYRLVERALAAFSGPSRKARESLDLVFSVMDSLHAEDDIQALFESLFDTRAPGDDGYHPDHITLHTTSDPNLFALCLRHFDSALEGRNTAFSLTDGLLLHAVFLHLHEGGDQFRARLRELRNLLAATDDGVRRARMADLLSDTEQLIRFGGTEKYRALRQYQAQDEARKRPFRDDPSVGPIIARLEDHALLRGTLTAFDLDAERLPTRAATFENLFSDKDHWKDLTAGLLASGAYYRRRPNSRSWQFGSATDSEPWRTVLTSGTPHALEETRSTLMRFLDTVAAGGNGIESVQRIIDDWLCEREGRDEFDWSYYLVKYPDMRSGATGIYVGDDGELSYTMCMMRRTQMNSYYRDPFLYQVWLSSEVSDCVVDPWFTGYEERWLRLRSSGVGIRNTSDGFRIRPADDQPSHASLRAIAAELGLDDSDDGSFHLRIRQRAGVDQENRIEKGAALLRALVSAGL